MLTETTDNLAAAMAERALASLSSREAIDDVVDLAVETEHARLVDLLIEARYVDDRQRALLLFLSGRFDRHAEVDATGALLRVASGERGGGMRRRIAAKARTADRAEWAAALLGDGGHGGDGDLIGEEWATALHLLTGAGRWDELWRLASEAPAVWAAPALRELARRGWRPSASAEADTYDRLVAIARRCGTVLSADCLFEDVTVLDASTDVTCLTANPVGDLLVAGAVGDTRSWRLPSGSPGPVLHGEKGVSAFLESVAVSPDGRLVAMGELDGIQLRAMPETTGGPYWGRGIWAQAAGSRFQHVAFAWDVSAGPLLVGGDSHGRVLTWFMGEENMREGLGRFGLPFHLVAGSGVRAHRREIEGLAVSQDGRFLVTGRRGENPRVWELPMCIPIGTLDDCADGVTSLAITPDGTLVAGASAAGTVRMWELPTGRAVGTVEDGLGFRDARAISSHGNVVIESDVGSVQMWEVPTERPEPGTTTQSLGSHGRLAISPDGELLVGANAYEGYVNVWRLPTRTFAGTLRGEPGGATCLVATRDGSVAATVATQTIRQPGKTVLWRSALPTLDTTRPGDITSADLKRMRQRRNTVKSAPDRALLDLIAELARSAL